MGIGVSKEEMLVLMHSLVSRYIAQHFTVRLVVSILHNQAAPQDLQLVQLEHCLGELRVT